MNKFLSRFDADNLGKTVIYVVIAILLIIASLFIRLTNVKSLTGIIFFIGFVMFFYSSLRLWEKPKYYLVLAVISLILILLLLFVGIPILMKMHLHRKVEDIAAPIGGVCISGFIAGIIGALRFRKYD